MTLINGQFQSLPSLELEHRELPSNTNSNEIDYYVGSHDPFKALLEGKFRHEPILFSSTTPNARPDWITEAEAEWLDNTVDTTGVSKPVAYLNNNTVTIKLKKTGLTKMDILRQIKPYEPYKKTATVQTSFNGEYNGNTYFFTGTSVSGNFTPVVTKYTVDQVGSEVVIDWQQVSVDEAKAVLAVPENQEKLRQNLLDAGVSTSFEKYLANIHRNLGDLSHVWGSHRYDLDSGYYQYQQHVDFNNWLVRKVVNSFGSGRIKGAALKISYLTIKESGKAGRAGKKGTAVEVMGGGTLRPDI